MQKKLFVLVLGVLVITSIGTVWSLFDTPAQAANSPEAAPFDAMQFARGAKAWANNCGRCHRVRDPKELRNDQWRVVMAHMRVRANLTGEESRDILAFLQASN